jgi:hypothetical protein
MIQLLGKIGFIHRSLWSRSGAYRIGLMVGPVPLLGAGLAFLAWALVSGVGVGPSFAGQWAKPKNSANWNAVPGMSIVEPTAPLPAAAKDGTFVGYRREWKVTTHMFVVSAAWQVKVDANPLTTNFISGPTFDVSRFFSRPQRANVAAVGTGMFVAKVAGQYKFAASFQRPAAPPASCLTRVVFGSRSLLSNIEGNIVEETAHTYEGATFELSPGLYPITFVFSCWAREGTKGPGQMTLLVQHPGEDALSPAWMVDIVRATGSRS